MGKSGVEVGVSGPGKGLRELREARCLTMAALAELAGVGVRTVWNAEHGRPVGMTSRRKILEALGVWIERHPEVFGPLPPKRAA